MIDEIQSLGGHVIQECVISEIFYHGLLVELPKASIEGLVNRYEEIELSQVDDIMFFQKSNVEICRHFRKGTL